MSTLREKVDDLNNMILQGQIMEAFEKYYAEDVVMQDNEHPARNGKDANREFEKDFMSSLTAFRGAAVKNVMISDDAGVAAIEWHYDYSHKEWGDRNYTQVSVQRWKDGQIVSEKFFYNG